MSRPVKPRRVATHIVQLVRGRQTHYALDSIIAGGQTLACSGQRVGRDSITQAGPMVGSVACWHCEHGRRIGKIGIDPAGFER